jgi:3-hydroxyacyl-CoA dehydrogenase
MSVHYEVRGACAVIALDNPPVNSFGHRLRVDIMAALDRAESDPAVRALVLTGSGKAFSGGADITEFAAGTAMDEPALPALIARIEQFGKPVIAAVNGLALGGGCEFALGCHYRVGTAGLQIGLPEVNLGILPGAGGTQRMPRLIGAAAALDMIVSGRPTKSEAIAKLGFFDRLVDGDVVAGAVQLAEEVLAKNASPAAQGHARGGPTPRLCDRSVPADSMPGGADAFFAAVREKIAASSKNLPAPLKCLEAVEASVRQPFDEGMRTELKLVTWLMGTPESRSLVHGFFAERAASKIPDVPESTQQRPIKSAAVIGAGTMGGGIAMALVNAGIPVVLLEVKQDALDRGLGVIRKNYENTAKKGRMTAEQVEQRMGLLKPTLDYADLKDADIVIEAVFEDMGIKEKVFKTLDEVMKPGAILASNTSMLDLDKIASFVKRPQDVIGTHFFSPANVMRLLEIVRGAKTAPDVLATTMQLARKIGKVGVIAGVCDGFIGNRMIEQYFRQAYFLCDEGALPKQIDAALEAWGMSMGPFRMLDMAGLDVSWSVRKRRYVEMPEMKYSGWVDRICELGRFGQKTGAGFYRYEPGNRNALPDPVVEDIVLQYAQEQGIARRQISDEEIVQRCIYALVNEGAHILEEGIAARASDIDVVYLTGYAFPAFRGGPMFYADTVGLENVVASMQQFAQNRNADPKFWQPAGLLAKLAAEGKTFN